MHGAHTSHANAVLASCLQLDHCCDVAKGDTNMTVKAQGLAYDPETRDWTKPVIYEARDRMDAIRWMNFNREWFKDLHIIED